VPNSYGIVVEGDFDKAVFCELIHKIRGQALPVRPRVCGGVPKLKKNFSALLRDLEHAHNGNPVDRVLVIRDADGGDPPTLEDDLAARIESQKFAFRYGVRFYAVAQQMDTLLLADPGAINRVAEARRVPRRRVTRPAEALESISNPKDYLADLLTLAGLQHTTEVCREIAVEADLALIRRHCPSFENFISRVVER
jgi:hypothetical protein